MEVRKVPAQSEGVEVTIRFTAEEWAIIEKNASWDFMTTEAYLKAAARSGPPRRGC